jgi:hypothetical protein
MDIKNKPGRLSAATPRVRWLVLPVLSALLFVPVSAEMSLGKVGDWQVRLEKGTTGIIGEVCVISTVSEIDGGRRERPRIRIIPSSRQVVIDPDRYLSGVITGIALFEHRSRYGRATPKQVLEHRIRIDDGEIVTALEQNPRYGAVEANPEPARFEAIMKSMSAGKILRYEWVLDRGMKTYDYSLDGSGAMLDIVDQNPACEAKGG